jgi:hypothetical protein
MRRLVVSSASLGLVALALGVSGCTGGGVETGIPQDTTRQPIPADIQTKMGPPPKKMPTPGKVGLLHRHGLPSNAGAYV